MPTYVYKFIDTGETIEVQQAFTDDALTHVEHPESGKKLLVKKVFTPVGVSFKGGGFYKTDSRGGKSKSSSSASTSADSSTSSTSSDSSTSTDSSSTKSSSGKSSSSDSSGNGSGSTSTAATPAAKTPAKAASNSD
jgi:predicted nucleic acid-binding Zn ribbon protein